MRLVTRAGVVAIHSAVAADALGGLLSSSLHAGRPTRTRDYVGRQLAAATHAAQRDFKARGGDIVFLDELMSPDVPFERVVWQTPLPGSTQGVLDAQIRFIVATRPAAPCRSNQLLGYYHDGENGMGLHFGNISLIDTATQPCSIGGRLTLTGIGADGRSDTPTVPQPIAHPLVLSPNTGLLTLLRDPTSALIATFGFAGKARDDPHARTGLCYDHETTPTSWRITVSTGAKLTIPNGALGRERPFYSCHGDLVSDAKLSVIGTAGVHLIGG